MPASPMPAAVRRLSTGGLAVRIYDADISCRRWGETETEKGPVDLFPVEPTDDAAMLRGDLEPWVQGTPRHEQKKTRSYDLVFLFVQKMGLEPTLYCYNRHLKPARLPIPPLLHVR